MINGDGINSFGKNIGREILPDANSMISVSASLSRVRIRRGQDYL